MSTYLELTNELLRRVQDTELTESNFASARSTQATAKDCIKASINEIMAYEKEWAFNFTSGSQILTIADNLYILPADCDSPDWESFRILKDDVINQNTVPLDLISKDFWYKQYRPMDEDSVPTGRMVPCYVFMSTEGGQTSFGVTPAPDKAYTVAFDYYVIETQLDLFSDSVRIPERFNYVIINGGLKHFNMYKDNTEQGAYWTKEFDNSMSRMRQYLAPRKDDLRDTRVNFGGPSWRSVYDITSP